jgi:hypothetical protein
MQNPLSKCIKLLKKLVGMKMFMPTLSMFYTLILADYSAGEIASTGQTSTQVPQSVHFAASITNISSPSDIASSGHSGSQAPQLMHSSLITCAIFFLLI